ncbi:hypothetical protein M0804_003403 [Polistes exclamans]|nr:hypothetical protein M0804_003403 [Polistes exclamans]
MGRESKGGKFVACSLKEEKLRTWQDGEQQQQQQQQEQEQEQQHLARSVRKKMLSTRRTREQYNYSLNQYFLITVT